MLQISWISENRGEIIAILSAVRCPADQHIFGPAANAALAVKLNYGSDPTTGDAEIRWAIEHAPIEVVEVLRQMPARQPGKTGWIYSPMP